jgi:hypothetical protein
MERDGRGRCIISMQKLIYGKGILPCELCVLINAQVEVPGHGKQCLDGKTGINKHY